MGRIERPRDFVPTRTPYELVVRDDRVAVWWALEIGPRVKWWRERGLRVVAENGREVGLIRDRKVWVAEESVASPSFGSVGDCFDNAAMEAFWATLKRELAWIHQRKHWASRAELRVALFDYIEVFYNRARHQARLEHRTPAETYAAVLVA